MTCVVCGDALQRDRGARGERCGTCSTYRYRRGADRSHVLVVKQTERDIERESRRIR